jgi:spore maturation protein SpmA
LLADLVILIHLLWILFLAVGFVFALKRSKLAYVHAGGLLFSLLLNLFGWYCPLTHLENYLHASGDAGLVYNKPFLVNTLERIVYPDMPEGVVRGGEIAFVLLNAVGYGWVLRRARFWTRFVIRSMK